MTWSQAARGIFSFSKIHARVPTDLNWPTMPKRQFRISELSFLSSKPICSLPKARTNHRGTLAGKKALGRCKVFMKRVSVLTRTIVVCWKYQFAGNQSAKQCADSICREIVFSLKLAFVLMQGYPWGDLVGIFIFERSGCCFKWEKGMMILFKAVGCPTAGTFMYGTFHSAADRRKKRMMILFKQFNG